MCQALKIGECQIYSSGIREAEMEFSNSEKEPLNDGGTNDMVCTTTLLVSRTYISRKSCVKIIR